MQEIMNKKIENIMPISKPINNQTNQIIKGKNNTQNNSAQPIYNKVLQPQIEKGPDDRTVASDNNLATNKTKLSKDVTKKNTKISKK